jgi:hypothetical protein
MSDEQKIVESEERWPTELDVLIGKKVESVWLNEDSDHLLFKTNGGDFCFYCVGECCSHSWIESIEDIESILGNEITEIVEHDISSGETEEHECLDVMNYDIKSLKGTCTIDFRNSSNGYYGGSLDKIENWHNVDFTKEVKPKGDK